MHGKFLYWQKSLFCKKSTLNFITRGLRLILGNLLGGPSPEKRSVLAIASIARNLGLALFIAGLSNSGQQLIPTLLTYMIFGAVLAVPYSIWGKRRMKLRDSK